MKTKFKFPAFLLFMISQHLIFVLLLVGISIFSHGQTVEMGLCFNSGNAGFYKNVPGISLGYNHHFKGIYVFSTLQGSLKNNSYSDIAPDLTDGSGYVMQQVEGQMHHIMVRTGIAIKIINSNDAGISMGLHASFNHFKLDDEIHYYFYDNVSEDTDFISSKKTLKDKFGGGCFIDFELKHLISDHISLFSKSTFDLIHYDGDLVGNPFYTGRLFNIGFSAGLRYSFTL
jgi:hypothetical protein